MNNHQIAKDNMYKKLLLFFANAANAAIWATFTRLVDEIANFVALNGDLDTATQGQAQQTKGITKGKNDALNAMIQKTVDMAFKAYVWAVDNDNDDLQEVFNVQVSDFEKLSEQAGLDKVKNIRKGINDNIGGMAAVELVPADVTALDGLISDYEAVRQSPEVTIGNKEASTDEIVELFHQIDSSLGLISRLLISHYSSTNGTMVDSFKNQKHIDDLPTHHSGIHTHITDALTGEDIEGAMLSIPALGKVATSDIDGIADIIKAKSGKYHVNVTMDGYQSQSFKTKIVRGKVVTFEIKLSQSSGGGGVTATREGDVTSPGIANIDITGINGTPLSQLVITVTGSAMRFYASAIINGVLGPADPFIDVMPGTNYQKLLTDFIALIGLNDTKQFLTVQNIGATPGHYTVVFDNLEE